MVSQMALKISKELREQLGTEAVALLETSAKDTDIIVGVVANYITKERFDEVNTQLGEVKTQNTTLDKDLKAAVKGAKTQEELNAKITELTTANEATKTEYETKIAERERGYLLEDALKGSKARNSKAVRSLLNLESVKVVDGKVIGLEEQIKALKTSDPYLFEETKAPETKVDRFGNPVEKGNLGTKTEADKVNSIVTAMGFEVPKK